MIITESSKAIAHLVDVEQARGKDEQTIDATKLHVGRHRNFVGPIEIHQIIMSSKFVRMNNSIDLHFQKFVIVVTMFKILI